MTIQYYTPTPGTVFIPFWSDEHEAFFRAEFGCNADSYTFRYMGGNGLVYPIAMHPVTSAGLPLNHSEFNTPQPLRG